MAVVTQTVVIESDQYAAEQAQLMRQPVVKATAYQVFAAIADGKADVGYLDTWGATLKLNAEFDRIGVKYETVGGPMKAVKAIVDRLVAAGV